LSAKDASLRLRQLPEFDSGTLGAIENLVRMIEPDIAVGWRRTGACPSDMPLLR